MQLFNPVGSWGAVSAGDFCSVRRYRASHSSMASDSTGHGIAGECTGVISLANGAPNETRSVESTGCVAAFASKAQRSSHVPGTTRSQIAVR
eukprot:1152543-Rhodomonas_salina.3